MRVGGKHRQYADEGESNELMSESYSRRSWKGIAVAFLVIGAVAAIITLIVIYSGTQVPWQIEGTLTLADIVNQKYQPLSFGSSQWTKNNSFYYLYLGNLMSYNIPENRSTIVVNNSTWGQGVTTFSPSPSGKFILYPIKKSKVFRHSFNATFKVVSSYNNLSSSPYSIANGSIIQYASWGQGDKLVYVQDNNIYYLDSYDGVNAQQVTFDGKPNVIFNGVPDWVYEEEILSSNSALWWSPSGTFFAFVKFNDSKVNDMYYMEYGNYDQYYPSLMDIKYPKPGFPNPTVTLWVCKTNNASDVIQVKLEDDKLHYITSVSWANDETLAVMWGPRTQNQSFVSLCTESSNWACTIYYPESTTGWLEPRKPYFSDDGKKFFLITSSAGFKHILMGDTEKNTTIFLTGGKYQVMSVDYYDSSRDDIYYTRTDEKGAEKRRLYRIQNVTTQRSDECLSCKSDCDWAATSVSPDGNYYALTCSSPTLVPIVQLYSTLSGTAVCTWIDNEDLKKKLANQTLSDFRDYKISAIPNNPSEGTIKIRVHVPKNFSETRKYPALVYVYGGPGSQTITNNFNIDFGTYLVTTKNYLYIEIDGRGSGNRGDNILFKIYKRLGTVEIQDQITAMKYLISNYTFVDPTKVAIWGWSYGGFAAAMTLAQGKDVFSCAMSVAPVTSWRYYDSVYTERYMLEPDDNPGAYKTSQLMNHISDLKNKQFLLLHGTADDNVHFQQSMMLTKALNNATILFDMHVYPDENHSIPKSTLHVYMTLEDFVGNCFA